jgi:hypothetical protein
MPSLSGNLQTLTRIVRKIHFDANHPADYMGVRRNDGLPQFP